MIAQLADITIEAENVGQLMVYGPQVMSAISGKTVDAKAVGGAKTMAAQGGVALTAKDEDEAISGGAGAGLSARLQRGGCRDCGYRRHEPHSARAGRGGRGKPAGCHGGRRGVCGALQGLRQGNPRCTDPRGRPSGRSGGWQRQGERRRADGAVREQGRALHPPVRLLQPAGRVPHQQQGRCCPGG